MASLTAQYSDMPKKAISSNAIDFILSPDEIASELEKISKNPQLLNMIFAAL